MKIRGIEFMYGGDVPFKAIKVVPLSCKFRCKGCPHKLYKKSKFEFDLTPQEIVAEATENGQEGIVLGGLEWTEQMEDMMALIEEAGKKNLEVAILTGLTANQLYAKIGRHVTDKVGFNAGALQTAMMDTRSDEFYIIVGVTTMDYYLSNGYYVRAGLYDKDKKSDHILINGVRLQSSNQNVYHVLGGETNER